jgi:tetratricopeptide (TPR) repeat protein
MVEKKPEAALDNLKKALDRDPAHMEAFTNLILIYAEQKNFDAADSACDAQLKKVAGNQRATAVVNNLKGGLLLAQKKSDEAEKQFRQAMAADPNYLPPYYALAQLYLSEKKEDQAMEQFEAVLDKNPKQTAPHMFLGIILESKGQADAAEKHYRAALEINPDFAPAANNLAYMLGAQNRDLTEALELARKAKRVNNEDPSISDTLGWIYYKKGFYDNALGELTDAVEKLPDNPTVRYHLGMTYLKKGETEKAKQELEKALELKDSFEGAQEAKEALAGLSS